MQAPQSSKVLALVRGWQAEGRPHTVDGVQAALTARFLMPSLPLLTAALRDLRQTIDRDVEAGRLRLPRRSAPYPKGYCQEITLTAHARLLKAMAAQTGEAASALAAFQAEGGVLTPIWGDLHGRYFQNALQMGGLYVDVANDTVDTAKPQVEIVPLADSGFKPVDTIEHFLDVARVYWTGRFFANTVFPRLAPVLPIIHAAPDGTVALKTGLAPIFAANLLDGCRPALASLMRARTDGSLPPPPVARACLDRMGTEGWLSGACLTPDWGRLQACCAEAAQPNGPYWAPKSFAAMIRTVERVVAFH